MARCDCYHQHGLKFLCYGTKEMEECSCDGDTSKCNFYPEKRKQKTVAKKRRLIDANALKRFLCKCCNILRSDEPCEPSDCNVLAVIDEQPTVEAVEVVRGRWEEWWPGDCALIMTGEEKLYRCSVCDAKYPDVEGFDFCPHCGNPMDGGKDDG